jgi:hypothetical protein
MPARSSLLIALLVRVASIDCTSPQKEKEFDWANARQEIEAANAEFIELFAEGDAAGVLGVNSPEAGSGLQTS